MAHCRSSVPKHCASVPGQVRSGANTLVRVAAPLSSTPDWCCHNQQEIGMLIHKPYFWHAARLAHRCRLEGITIEGLQDLQQFRLDLSCTMQVRMLVQVPACCTCRPSSGSAARATMLVTGRQQGQSPCHPGLSCLLRGSRVSCAQLSTQAASSQLRRCFALLLRSCSQAD